LQLKIEKQALTPLLTEEQIMHSRPFKQLLSEATKLQELVISAEAIKSQHKTLEQQILTLKQEKTKNEAKFKTDCKHYIQEIANYCKKNETLN
jgi:hypothetical protein